MAVITGLEDRALPEVASAPDEESPPEPVGLVRWVSFGALTIVAIVHSAYSMGGLTYWSLTSDQGAQYYLSRLTALGAVPLVDFQHGWNAGSWWFGGVLYRLAGGDPTVWTYFNNRLFGCTLAAVLLAAIGVRLRLHPAAMAAVVFAALFVVRPLSVKYMFPIAFAFLLLPTPWLDEGRRRLVVRAAVPAAMFWFHVELAVLMSAATVLFELVGARDEAVRERILRAGAVVGGLVAGFVTQVAYFGLRFGMSVGELNRQVVFGQAEEFPHQFGWPFFNTPPLSNQYVPVALFPTLVVVPFVPYVWRRLSDPTRYVAFAAVCLATIAIRRPGPGHGGTVGAMVALAVVLALSDLQAQALPVRWRVSPRIALGVAVGAVATAAVIKVGFDLDSFAGPAILLCGCTAVAVVVARFRTSLVSFSAGSLAVLAALPVVTSIDRVGRMSDADESLVMADTMATSIAPEVDRCLVSDEALIIPTVLPLYERLQLRNPTPYYLFHYDFGRNKDDVLEAFESGRVPAVILSMNMPSALPWLKDALTTNYVRCSHIGIEGPGHAVEVWVHDSRSVEDRTVTVKANIEVSVPPDQALTR